MQGQSTTASLRQPAVTAVAGLSENRWARWCVYALVAFPLVDYGLRLHSLSPLGSIWDKVVLIAVAVMALTRYMAGVRPPHFRWVRFAGLYILYVVGLMFAGLAHPIVAIEGLRFDVYFIFYPLLLPYLVAPKDVPKLLHVAVLIAILIGLDGVYQYMVATPIPPGWADVNEHVRSRVFSVLKSPNELGAYMALMIPFVIGMAVSERDRWRKWLYIVGVVLCVGTLAFTFTRGAWVALAVALLIMAVVFERRLLIVLVVLAVIGFFLPPIHHRITDLFSPVYLLKSSQGGRILKWTDAFAAMSTNPLFGAGLGHFGGAVASDFHYSSYSDNYYAKLLGESGIVGLALFLAMQLALFRDLFRNVVKKAPKHLRFAVLGAVTGLLAVLMHNTIENVFEYPPVVSIYFVYASLLLIWSRGFEGGDTDGDSHSA